MEVVDEGIRFEAWTLPESGTFERRFHLFYPTDYTIQVRPGGSGSGSVTVPAHHERAEQILTVDLDDRSNDQGSLIRAFRGSDPIMDFYVNDVRHPDTEDGEVVANGGGILSALGFLKVLAYDYPTQPSVDPDHVYGAPSLLPIAGFEDGGTSAEIWRIFHDGTGGTFRLRVDTGTYTAAIAWNASASDVAAALETLTEFTEVRVSGFGTSAFPWEIECVDPLTAGGTLNADFGPLTGDTIGMVVELVTQGGTPELGQWETSRSALTGQEYGRYEAFEISTEQAHTGTYSLKVDGDVGEDGGYPGAQVPRVRVTPGKTYRGSFWVRSSQALNMRAVVRDSITGVLVPGGSSTWPETTLVPNTWTELVIPPFVMAEGVEEVDVRVAVIAGTNPDAFYLDDATFSEGLPPATFGEIFNDLLDDLATHKGFGTWLNRTWTDSLDSNGDPWDQTLSWAIKRGQSLSQLVAYAARWGYEVAIDWNTGTDQYDLGLFLPGGYGTDHSAVEGGPTITRRDGVIGAGPFVTRAPGASEAIAEGAGGAWAEASDTNIAAAWPGRMAYFGNKTARDSTELAAAAQATVNEQTSQVEGFSVRLQNPSRFPGSDYRPGDTITINLEPTRPKRARRISAVTITRGQDGHPEYQVAVSSLVFEGTAAIAEGVNRLLDRFEGLENEPDEPVTGCDCVCACSPGCVDLYLSGLEVNESAIEIQLKNQPSLNLVGTPTACTSTPIPDPYPWDFSTQRFHREYNDASSNFWIVGSNYDHTIHNPFNADAYSPRTGTANIFSAVSEDTLYVVKSRACEQYFQGTPRSFPCLGIVTPGQTFEFSCWAKTGPGGGEITLAVQVFDVRTFNWIALNSDLPDDEVVALNGTYQKVTLSGTIPTTIPNPAAGPFYFLPILSVDVTSPGSGEGVWIDDITVTFP